MEIYYVCYQVEIRITNNRNRNARININHVLPDDPRNSDGENVCLSESSPCYEFSLI